MKRKLIYFLVGMLLGALMLSAGSGLRVFDSIRYIVHIEVVNTANGCQLNFDPFRRVWWVEQPGGTIIFEGPERQAMDVLLFDCP